MTYLKCYKAGGGILLEYEDFGRMFNNSFPICAFFFLSGDSLHTLIPLFRPGSIYSRSVSRDNCDRVFPDKLRVSSFTDRFPHYARIAA